MLYRLNLAAASVVHASLPRVFLRAHGPELSVIQRSLTKADTAGLHELGTLHIGVPCKAPAVRLHGLGLQISDNSGLWEPLGFGSEYIGVHFGAP